MHKILRLIGIFGIVLLFTARVEVYAQPNISGITPNIGINNGTISVTITGSGFSSEATVSLAQDGISIIGSPTTIIESNTIMTTFDLTDAPIGSLSVVVTNPDNESGTLSDGFNILPIPPNLSFTKSVTHDVPVSPGVTLTYTLCYVNIGLGTATAVVITDAIPAGTTYITGTAKGDNTNISYSRDGGINYGSSSDSPVTHIKWGLTVNIVSGGSGNVNFDVRVE